MDCKISKRISLLSFLMTLMIVVFHCQCQGDPTGFGTADVFLFTALSENIDTFGMVAMSYFFASQVFCFSTNWILAPIPQRLKSVCFRC